VNDLLVCFVPFLSSCHEKATVVTSLSSFRFLSFPVDSFDFFPLNLLFVRNPQEEIIIAVPYNRRNPRTQQRNEGGCWTKLKRSCPHGRRKNSA